jgi:hypothetical protein
MATNNHIERNSPVKKKFVSTILLIVCAMLTATASRAQTITSPAADLWTAVPDSDFVVSLNISRILNDALPKVLGDDAATRKKAEETVLGMKVLSGVDAHRVTRAVVAGRLTGTGMDVNLQEFVVIADGEFNYADIKDAFKGPNRGQHEEKYGTNTLLIFRESDDPKAKKNELMAVAMLGPNLMAAGHLNAVKRAVDAFRDGKGRASPDLLSRGQSDSDALASLAARIPASYLQPKGTEPSTSRLMRLLASIKFLEATLRLGENAFPLTVAVRSETADAAGDIRCMLESMRTVAAFAVPDKSLMKMLDDLKITQDGNAAALQTEITFDQIRSIVNPPKPAPATKPDKQ